MKNKLDVTALAAAYARGRAHADALSSITDELNVKITEAENALAALKLGVAASVGLPSSDDPNDGRSLCFEKLDKAWRLTYEWGSYGDAPENWSATPLTNAPRDVRMDAVDQLPSLLEKMIANAAAEADRVKAKVADMDAFITTVKGLGGGK